MNLRRARIMIVGGNNTAGPLPDLTRFLSAGRAKEVSFIGHPFEDDFERRYQLLHYRGGRSRQRWTLAREPHWWALSYLWDLLLTTFFILILRRRHDLYVSGSPHFGLLGLILKRLGIVRRTVFWTHDYHPRRFRNPLLNGLYLRLDRLVAEESDWSWDVVPTIGEHRRERGVRMCRERVLVVGDPLEDKELASLPAKEVPAGSILLSGLVKDGYGFDLLVEAIPLVRERNPSARVTVTTYGPFPERLRTLISERGLEDCFDLLGFIPDDREYSQVVQRQRVGLALYEPRTNSHKKYSDSRVKTYLARGVPVVMTGVSPIAAEIESADAGVIIEYDKEQLVDALLKLLSDDDFYGRCRENAITLAEQYRVDRVIPAAFERMGIEP